jgi:hypothetical protein
VKEEVREALEASIVHWEENANGKGEMRFDSSACPLCQLFTGNCFSCPVRKKTGRGECARTPWREILRHYLTCHYFGAYRPERTCLAVDCPTCRVLSEKEVAFLVSLRPAEDSENKKEEK